MIDAKDYTLEFICKETGKVFKGRAALSGLSTTLLDPETGLTEVFSTHFLRIKFKSVKGNRYKNKPPRCRPTACGNHSKAFREYLNGAS